MEYCLRVRSVALVQFLRLPIAALMFSLNILIVLKESNYRRRLSRGRVTQDSLWCPGSPFALRCPPLQPLNNTRVHDLLLPAVSVRGCLRGFVYVLPGRHAHTYTNTRRTQDSLRVNNTQIHTVRH